MHPTITLIDGNTMPPLFAGTWMQSGRQLIDVLATALTVRSASGDFAYGVDSAQVYGNLGDVGKAVELASLAVNRSDMRVLSKLWNADHGYRESIAAIERMLEQSGLAYFDAMLIHWPVPGKPRHEAKWTARIVDTWRGMQECQRLGYVRSIGVSNFTSNQLAKIRAADETFYPALVQVEVHPRYVLDRELHQMAMSPRWGFKVMAYSPFGSTAPGMNVLGDPVVTETAHASHMTPAQAVLVYLRQRYGAIPVPRTMNPRHLLDNASAIDLRLDAASMARIGTLGTTKRHGLSPLTMHDRTPTPIAAWAHRHGIVERLFNGGHLG